MLARWLLWIMAIVYPLGDEIATMKSQSKVLDPSVSVVDLSVAELSDPAEQALRRVRNSRYNNPGDAPLPLEDSANFGGIYNTAHWWMGIPKIPVELSDAIVVGRILEARAYLPDDRSFPYSEFAVSIRETLKEGESWPLPPAARITVQRIGGAVRYASGRVAECRVASMNYPLVGHDYLLFLQHIDPGEDFYLLAGYELRNESFFALDNSKVLPFESLDGTPSDQLLQAIRAEVVRSAGVIPILAGSMAISQPGDVFFTNRLFGGGSRRVYRLDAKTGVIARVAGNGERRPAAFGQEESAPADGKPAIHVGLDVSRSALDTAGNMYLSNFRWAARVDAATGLVRIVAGGRQTIHSGDGGLAVMAGIDIFALAVQNPDCLFLGDAMHNRIRKVDIQTGLITTVAGNGKAEFSGDGGPATAAGLNHPGSITVDPQGNLFIVDDLNYGSGA